jgi:hypothetical protein
MSSTEFLSRRHIVEQRAIRATSPAAEMHLVDRNRLVRLLQILSAGKPVFVVPWHIAKPVHDRGRRRRRFLTEPERIGLERQPRAIGPDDLELVAMPRFDARDEKLEEAAAEPSAHGMAPPIPEIEVTNHRNPSGIRRPQRKGRPGYALMHHGVGTKPLVELLVATFRDQILVEIAKYRAEAIGIFQNVVCAVPVHIELVEPTRRTPDDARKETRRIDAVERLGFLTIRPDDCDRKSIGQKRRDP